MAQTKARYATLDSPEIKAARLEHIEAITGDPRYFALLNPSQRKLMRQLLWWHNPLNGHLGTPTAAYRLTDHKRLDCSESTLKRNRKVLLALGLIVSYQPGNGHAASEYVIARSWEEAEQAVALREAQGENAPYWPEMVTRTPSVPGKRPMDEAAEAAAAQAAAEAAAAAESAETAAAAEAAEEEGRKRRERQPRIDRRYGPPSKEPLFQPPGYLHDPGYLPDSVRDAVARKESGETASAETLESFREARKKNAGYRPDLKAS